MKTSSGLKFQPEAAAFFLKLKTCPQGCRVNLSQPVVAFNGKRRSEYVTAYKALKRLKNGRRARALLIFLWDSTTNLR